MNEKTQIKRKNVNRFLRRYAKRKIGYIKTHAPEVDTSRFEENLERLESSLDQVWAVTHGDCSFGNILLIQGSPERLAIIDFTDVLVCDPSVDFSYFADDLVDEGIEHGPIIESVLKHYGTDDGEIARKIEFRRLVREVVLTFRKVRSSVRSR